MFITLFKQFLFQGSNLLVLSFNLLPVLDALILRESHVVLLQFVVLLCHLNHFGAYVIGLLLKYTNQFCLLFLSRKLGGGRPLLNSIQAVLGRMKECLLFNLLEALPLTLLEF